MKKHFVSFIIVLMIAMFPAERAMAQGPSTYIYEGETIIWKIRDIPVGRFPFVRAVDVHLLSEKFNQLYEAGFRVEDLNVDKSEGLWALFIGNNPLFTVSQEHAEFSMQDPEIVALTFMSRLYEAIGRQYTGELTSEYQIRGQYETSGYVSWFGERFIGRKFANGETFTETHLAAASTTLPFGTLVKVTVPSGRSVVVRVTDRFRGHRNRVLDLSEAAAGILDIKGGRVPNARIEIIGITGRIGGK